MQTLPQAGQPGQLPAIHPHVTIRRHQSGAWQPIYVDARGAQMLRIYIRRNDRQSVESAVKAWATLKGIEYRAPEQAETLERVERRVIAEVRAVLQGVAA